MRQLLAVSPVLLLSLSLAAQQWQRLPSTAHPPENAYVAMAHDAVRNRIVCVSDEQIVAGPGFVIGRVTTWEWDGRRWLQRVTATAPTAFAMQHAMAYDPTRGRVVLVNRGGETWSFDGVDWRLEPITGPFTVAPSLAFDAVRGVLVLATGSASWHGVYEVVNGAWTLRATFAPAQESAVIGFDPISGRMLAFGGINYFTGPTNVDTTLSWDGTTLTTLAPATVPNGRSEHVLANDPTTGQLLLIGGVAWQSPLGAMADVYAWNGADWVAQPALPAPRRRAAAAPLGGSLLLFGGNQALGWNHYSHELLQRTGGTWATVPLLAAGPTAAHDTARSRTVSVDGTRTLEFDGYAWTDTGIVFPGVGGAVGLAYHAQTARTVAFAGNGSTWLFDGLAWNAAVAPIAPSPRTGAGMTHDPLRNVVVLFGGQGLADVWEWNGAAWSNPLPTLAPPAGGNALGWDGQRVVMVSPPTASLGSTWAWDGTSWTFLNNIGGTSPRLGYDPAVGLVLLRTIFQPYQSDSDHSSLLVGNTWQALPGTMYQSAGGGSLVLDGNRGLLVFHDALHHRDFAYTSQPATTGELGTSCGTPAPVLSPATSPQLGGTALTTLAAATPASFAFLFADFASANVPLPGGCTLLLPNAIALGGAPTSGGGVATFELFVPPNAALHGITVFEQALVLDPAGALFGFANLSNAVQFNVGD